MTTALSRIIFLVTIIGCLHGSSSNIITDGISKAFHYVEKALHLDERKCIFPQVVCDKFEEILKTGPNLTETIAKLDKDDFLEKYKAAEKNEERDMTMHELVAKYGYKLQTYTVETEDGYLIALHRIPGKGDPVLLGHGITLSAVDWFTIGPENALPCVLADEGYDVWVLSARGSTTESQGHVSLTLPKDEDKYWDFSFDEIGRYDLPASIDFMIKETGRPKVKYVGFSQGTSVFYVMAAERPEYNEKVSIAVQLASIAWLPRIKSPLFRLVGELNRALGTVREVFGFNMVNGSNPFLRFMGRHVCGNELMNVIVCSNAAFSIFGFNYDQINVTQGPVIAAHYPSTLSTKQLIHYGQLIKSATFRRYDYGLDKNMDIYGSELPPDYPVENISSPVALFYTKKNDWSSIYEDVLILKNKLPNLVDFYEVSHPSWAHMDYLWAKDVKKFAYVRLLELFKKY
ncbi:alpha/beta-hydrolase lipase region domain-containing protein [Phthorimaea operculella]|nr:alpha/beta-hydrolase lipase region domain-containing protein [Phthorimaea operculella]